jgi:hypothetical protein
MIQINKKYIKMETYSFLYKTKPNIISWLDEYNDRI